MHSESDSHFCEETACGGSLALLQRVATSPLFQKSSRHRELLLYLGERGLRDPSHLIREQEIGVEVFHRPADFDTTQDTLVRVHVSQLRKKLQQYFTEDGADEPLVIDIPKGSYTPVFRLRAAAAAAPEPPSPAATTAAPRRAPARVVLVLGAGLLALIAICILLWTQNRALRSRAGLGVQPAVDRFWRQMFANGQPTTLVLGDANLVLFQDRIQQVIPLNEYENKGFGPLAERRIADPAVRSLALEYLGHQFTSLADAMLVRPMSLVAAVNSIPMEIVLARSISASQVTAHNAVLLGTHRANPWIRLFEDSLNFQSVFEETPPRVASFVNRRPQKGEQERYTGVWREHGYCRVAFLSNLRGPGSVLIISGTEVNSTEAGGALVTTEKGMRDLRDALGVKTGEDLPYFEVLLNVAMVNAAVPRFSLVAWRRY